MLPDLFADLTPTTSAGRDFVARIRGLTDASRTSDATLVDQLGKQIAVGTSPQLVAVAVNGCIRRSASFGCPDAMTDVDSQ